MRLLGVNLYAVRKSWKFNMADTAALIRLCKMKKAIDSPKKKTIWIVIEIAVAIRFFLSRSEYT